MKAIQRSPTREELDARVREWRLQSWRRRSIAAIATAALVAGSVTPAISLAEPGGWGPSESSSSTGTSIGSSSPSSRESSSVSSPSDAADAAGPSGSGTSIGSSSPSSRESGSDSGTAIGPSSPSSRESSVASPTEAADAAPASSPDTGTAIDPSSPSSRESSASDPAPAVTAMGDAAGPAAEPPASDTTAAEPTFASPQEAVDAAPATEPADTGTAIGPSSPSSQEPAVTAMGDVGGPAVDTSTPATPEPEADYEAPATTAMGDYAGPAGVPADTLDAPEETTSTTTTPAVPDDGPAVTPMGDVGAPGAETGIPAGPPAETTPAAPANEPDGFQANLTATWGLGGTIGFAHDSEFTSITVGPAEGTGLFGSVGQGQAARQTTPGASAKLGIGPMSGEFAVDQTGITGKANLNIPLNPGVNQQNQYTAKLNQDFSVTTTHTEGVSYGVQQGAAITQTVTIAIPNSAFEAVANVFGFGPQSAGRQGGW